MNKDTWSRRKLLGSLAGVASAALPAFRGRAAAVAKSVAVSDFGALPDGSDAGPGFARACAEISQAGGGRLTIPPGVYSFEATDGVALGLVDLDDVEIHADGAALLFRGLCHPLVFRNCGRVAVNGLRIDWARAPFSQGDVARLSDGGRVAEIELDALTPMDGWTTIEAVGGYDRAAKSLSRKRVDAINAVVAIEPLSARRVRIRFRNHVELEPGETVVLRHQVYGAHAVELLRCGEVHLSDVVVRAGPGMAFVGGRCRNVRLDRCVVEPDPERGLLMSTNADAAHFSDCDGQIVVDACRFGQMGDDGLNVNTNYWRVIERRGGDAVVIAQRDDAAFQTWQSPASEDRVEFASSRTLEALDEVDIAEVADESAANRKLLRLRRAVPDGVRVGDVLLDETRIGTLIARNCVFANNRARGVLAHRNATITNCLFQNQSAQAILLAPSLFWMEGPEIANVVIENNVFDGVDRWGLGKGAISIGAEIIGDDGQTHTSHGLPNHDILIRNNVFRNFSGEPVVAYATRW